MTFTITRLMNSEALVFGTDVNGVSAQTIVNTEQWDEVTAHSEFDQAAEAFDAAVEAFFAPLTEAAEKLNETMAKPKDSVGFVVLHERVDGTEAKPEVLVKLSRDSIILRLIASGDTDRLMWVDGELVVTALV